MIIRHVIAWCGIAFLAVLNGAARELLYAPFAGALLAHQISTLLLIAVIGAAAWFLQARWPLSTMREAAAVGACWMLQTAAFECVIGRVFARKEWDAVFADYDVAAGRIWVLVPLWLLVAPELVRRRRAAA